jgi:hypothetical protein
MNHILIFFLATSFLFHARVPVVENFQGSTIAPPTHFHRPLINEDESNILSRSDNGRMVILRTFCPFDIDKLADGFDSWASFFPCESNHDTSLMDVDILLFFSASWDLWPKAKLTSEVLLYPVIVGI